ncbi:hypothetical protein [Bacillus sp. FJAT-45350]|uniref:hypothetical protein n=1 Tax=Bacillus sp. FJAT-45350 TaxID=2011014 RepID=UPI000BB6B72D|nr:hypothetical protein [Bacillus sp. FJAT-45350]
MLVEVNLLPEKEKRDLTPVIIILIIGILLVTATIVLSSLHSSVSTEVTELENEVQELMILSETTRQELTEQQTNNIGQLEEVISALDKQLFPASLLLDHIVSLLPERGFFLNFNYSLPNEVYFDASFDRIEEIAQFSNALYSSDAIGEVLLSDISTNQILDDEDLNRDEYLPRYVASYSIKIVPVSLREMRDEN